MKLDLDRIKEARVEGDAFKARLLAGLSKSISPEMAARVAANHQSLMAQLAPGQVPPWVGPALERMVHGNRT